MMLDDIYKVITTVGEGLYKEKGSKFYAFCYPVITEEEVKTIMSDVKKKFFDARHHCYAFMIGPNKSCYRSSDDGEPSGTAGKPILNQILSKDVTNVLVVVVRYFGGVKLGVPGLINAYKTAAREALDNATVIEKTVDDVYSLEFDYPLMNEVMRVLKEENLEQQNPKFEMRCYLEISIRKGDSERIVDKLKHLYGLDLKYLKTI
ncbi:MAG TPA: YigZ family protein [Bacteroidetes bacterium]|nr:YigZ family protein [Candidatus Limimorpha avicola]